MLLSEDESKRNNVTKDELNISEDYCNQLKFKLRKINQTAERRTRTSFKEAFVVVELGSSFRLVEVAANTINRFYTNFSPLMRSKLLSCTDVHNLIYGNTTF